MIIVLDTVVFVRALINPKSICGKIIFAHSDKYQLILSKPTVEEALEVLKRPEITKKFKSYDQVDFRKIVDTILNEAEIVEFLEVPTASRDPKDNKFLATAKHAKAQYLISHDRDLLDLKKFEGIKIIDCFAFVSILESL